MAEEREFARFELLMGSGNVDVATTFMLVCTHNTWSVVDSRESGIGACHPCNMSTNEHTVKVTIFPRKKDTIRFRLAAQDL